MILGDEIEHSMLNKFCWHHCFKQEQGTRMSDREKWWMRLHMQWSKTPALWGIFVISESLLSFTEKIFVT